MNANQTNQEMLVGQNKFFLGNDNILYVFAIGDADGESAATFNKVVTRFRNQLSKPVTGVLVDLDKAGASTPEARKVWRQMSEEGDQTIPAAFIGLHPVARVLAAFLIGVSSNKNLRFFSRKEDAVNWLLSRHLNKVIPPSNQIQVSPIDPTYEINSDPIPIASRRA